MYRNINVNDLEKKIVNCGNGSLMACSYNVCDRHRVDVFGADTWLNNSSEYNEFVYNVALASAASEQETDGKNNYYGYPYASNKNVLLVDTYNSEDISNILLCHAAKALGISGEIPQKFNIINVGDIDILSENDDWMQKLIDQIAKQDINYLIINGVSLLVNTEFEDAVANFKFLMKHIAKKFDCSVLIIDYIGIYSIEKDFDEVLTDKWGNYFANTFMLFDSQDEDGTMALIPLSDFVTDQIKFVVDYNVADSFDERYKIGYPVFTQTTPEPEAD